MKNDRIINNINEIPGLSPEKLAEIASAAEHYPFRTSWSFLQKAMNSPDPQNSAIWKQCIPSADELKEFPGFESEDGLGEDSCSPLPLLIHKYPDRALLLVTNRCPVYCRFCFRKRRWKNGEADRDITDDELNAICAYLKEHKEIREVLLSGGDPLMLSDSRLIFIISNLIKSGIETIRICSRIPSTMPDRISDKLMKTISAFGASIWFLTHFNHPDEFDCDSREACRKIIKNGIPILNQTVLLKGVNDDAELLAKLFRELVRTGVKPHYLFHADPVCGTGHFATGVAKGLELVKYFRENLSSLAVPVFALDLPEGGGKVPLQAEYYDSSNNSFKAIDGRTISHPASSIK